MKRQKITKKNIVLSTTKSNRVLNKKYYTLNKIKYLNKKKLKLLKKLKLAVGYLVKQIK